MPVMSIPLTLPSSLCSPFPQTLPSKNLLKSWIMQINLRYYDYDRPPIRPNGKPLFLKERFAFFGMPSHRNPYFNYFDPIFMRINSVASGQSDRACSIEIINFAVRNRIPCRKSSPSISFVGSATLQRCPRRKYNVTVAVPFSSTHGDK